MFEYEILLFITALPVTFSECLSAEFKHGMSKYKYTLLITE
jgi:hypothetical protein